MTYSSMKMEYLIFTQRKEEKAIEWQKEEKDIYTHNNNWMKGNLHLIATEGKTGCCSVQKTYLHLLTIGLALARASAQLQDSNIPPTGRVAGGDTLSPSVL